MIPVDAEIIKYKNQFFIIRNERALAGDLIYFKEAKVIGTSIFPGEKFKVIATPDQIGWLLNDGPPHDHNYDFRGKYIEPIIKIKEGVCKVMMEEYYETGLEAPLPLIPTIFKDKIIITEYGKGTN